MHTTVITVHAINKGKVIAKCSNTVTGWQRIDSLRPTIGALVYEASQWAAPQYIDMTMPETSFSIEIRHCHNGHL